jgi:cellulose synthase/poly-beta-1,6-N-acetylglucosamine synthase-like glycosyltransferase
LADVRWPISGLSIVIIGRNEGERLRRCLDAVVGRRYLVVYVDSGSTDGSVELARAKGAEVVELDMSRPFTAARARNAGVARISEIDPEFRFVQFVDGDCELVDGWLDKACELMEDCAEVAVVCGRRRERFPERSVYNRLADLEWDSPVGETKSFGGIALLRATAFRQVNGFNPSIIAAEEDELCLRMRRKGWKVVRIAAEMALHDIAMTRAGQWWRRNVRCGHAYAEGCARHGCTPERHFVRQTGSTIFWGLLVPLLAFGLAWPTHGASFVILVGYLFLYWRIQRYGVSRGWSAPSARLYALACVLAKFPMLAGLFTYAFRRITRRPRQIIEYK